MHLFAGAGGGILADILLGHQPVCAVEINNYCQQVLAARQEDGSLPWFPIFDDVTKFDGKPWRGLVDVVSGGFPCQDISSAGSGAGIDGERSGLWREMARIIREIRPRFVFVENSPMLSTRGLGKVLGALAEMGFDAEWGVLGTSDVGGHCKRERMWIVARSTKDRRKGVLHNHKRIGKKTDVERREPGNDYPCSRIDRIRALESISCEPAILASNDGLAYPMDQINALGNGQHAALAATAFRILSDV